MASRAQKRSRNTLNHGDLGVSSKAYPRIRKDSTTNLRTHKEREGLRLDTGELRDIGFFSKALNQTERNYDIWDREFMAVVFGLRNWRHLLSGSPHPVVVWTDHANLQYYRHPQKINRRVARYIALLSDYNLVLKHLPGTKNRADALSRRPDHADGQDDNADTTALPSQLFVKVIEMTALEEMIHRDQKQNEAKIKVWKEKEKSIECCDGIWKRGSATVVTRPEEIGRDLLEWYHDTPTAGHPGILRTGKALMREYWWPNMKRSITQYVKGCGECQQNKTITHPNRPPLNPITPSGNPEPFKTISVDLIVKLPESNGNDSILTVTDQGTTKAVILIPCREDMSALDLARTYVDRAFPYIGLPDRLISDRDTRLTSQLFREICNQLKVQQNISSAYHPQTDGSSERTNQTVETALRIFCNFQANDWAKWLPIVQDQINSHENSTTKSVPYEVWMGYVPRAHQPIRKSQIPKVEERKAQLKEVRERARDAMNRAQETWVKETKFKEYRPGEKVWLEGKNLRTFHPSTKLRPKRFRPFEITEVLGPTTYRLNLPPQWKVHNAFHGALLNPFVETPEHGPNYVEPPPELVEGEPEYEVETLLGSRRHGRKRRLEYLVRWKGYAPAHDSWEPAQNLHAPELIKEFYEREPLAIRTIRMKGNSEEESSPLASSFPSSPWTERSFSSTPDHLPFVRRVRYLDMLPTRLDKPRAFEDRHAS